MRHHLAVTRCSELQRRSDRTNREGPFARGALVEPSVGRLPLLVEMFTSPSQRSAWDDSRFESSSPSDENIALRIH